MYHLVNFRMMVWFFNPLVVDLVSSSPIDPPQLSYGRQAATEDQICGWVWDEVPSPLMAASNKVNHHFPRCCISSL